MKVLAVLWCAIVAVLASAACSAPSTPSTPAWQGPTATLEGQVAPLAGATGVVSVVSPAPEGGVLVGSSVAPLGVPGLPVARGTRVGADGNLRYSLDLGMTDVAGARSVGGTDLYAGTFSVGNLSRPAFRRFTSAGVPDPTFGLLGTAVLERRPPPLLPSTTVAPDQTAIRVDGVEVDGTGRIYASVVAAVGGIDPRTSVVYRWVLRLTAAGALDTTFGDAGYVALGVSWLFNYQSPIITSKLLALADGSVAVAWPGQFTAGVALVRPDGSIVGPVGLGAGTDPFPCSNFWTGVPVGIIRSGSRLLVSMSSDGPSCFRNPYGVVALRSDLSIDTTFGVAGGVSVPTSAASGAAFAKGDGTFAIPVLSYGGTAPGTLGLVRFDGSGTVLGGGVATLATGLDIVDFRMGSMLGKYGIQPTPASDYSVGSAYSDSLYLAGSPIQRYPDPASSRPVVLKVKAPAL